MATSSAKETEALLPQYTEIDPLPRPASAHPDLVNADDSLHRVLQAKDLYDSRIHVLSRTQCATFRGLCDFIGQRENLHSLCSTFPEGGLALCNEIRKTEDHYILHTTFHVHASSSTRLWARMIGFRVAQTCHKPCPHLDFADHKHGDLLCASISNFDAFCKQLEGVNDDQQHCDRCVTSYRSHIRTDAKRHIHIAIHTWHDLGPLTSPNESCWIRLAAKDPTAVTPGTLAQSSRLRALFESAKPRQVPEDSQLSLWRMYGKRLIDSWSTTSNCPSADFCTGRRDKGELEHEYEDRRAIGSEKASQ
ncbi:hypothetical protein ANO11243_053940 [Dothideomycetidae sp. 11243]|nr:hypothetical protein ANO11243_053940 [fungal sp. No.11243]